MNDVYRDRLDIIELFNRYAAALDDRRWDELAKLYMPDATAEQPEGSPLLVGPEVIVGMISAAIDWLGPTMHHLGNYIVTVDGDRAKASCYVRGFHAGRGEHAGKSQETLARLSTTLVRTPDGWRFSSFVERIIHMLGSTEIFNPDLMPGG
jgi:ketosteroid isomerase-like protein